MMQIEYGPPGAVGVKQLAYVSGDVDGIGDDAAPSGPLAAALVGLGVYLLTKKPLYGAAGGIAAWFVFGRK